MHEAVSAELMYLPGISVAGREKEVSQEIPCSGGLACREAQAAKPSVPRGRGWLVFATHWSCAGDVAARLGTQG